MRHRREIARVHDKEDVVSEAAYEAQIDLDSKSDKLRGALKAKRDVALRRQEGYYEVCPP